MKNILLSLFIVTSSLAAQKTMQLAKHQTSPNAKLEKVSWIAGHWRGEAFDGITEELWSPPLGDSMMFVFKLVNEGAITFYEAGHIKQVDSTLVLQLKHFDGNLRGWERKDETIDFKLVKLEENIVYFEGLTMQKIDANSLNVHVLIGEEGKEEEVLFKYKRVPTNLK